MLQSIDLGCLLLEDCRSFTGLNKEQVLERTQENLTSIYNQLFELKKQQKLQNSGDDGEFLEYTKSTYLVQLPEKTTILPREKAIPKVQPLTKWEKFRLEKGIQAKQKRSRMVYDEITKDWVPRFGMGSVKKIEDRHNWVMEEKPKHLESGLDPFTYKKNEKKLEKEKQDLRELKNQVHANAVKEPKSDVKVLQNETTIPENKQKSSMKQREEKERELVRKREKKALLKSLQLAQISTGSMGKFDKKVNKYEPDAPKSQKILKKKSNSVLAKLQSNKSLEKERNLKIFTQMEKEKDYAVAGLDRAKAAQSKTKIDKKVGQLRAKEDKRRSSLKKS